MRSILSLVLVAFAAPALAAAPALVAYMVHDAATIPEPLTPAPADPARGAGLAGAQCAACHGGDGAAAALSALVQGRDAGALRLAVVNLAIARPEIAGHAFHDAGTDEVAAAPLLSAQEVEDVVAWLAAGAP